MFIGRKVGSKSNSIWTTLSRVLGNKISPTSLYTLVICDRYLVKTKLLDQAFASPPGKINVNNIEEKPDNDSNSNSVSTEDSSF